MVGICLQADDEDDGDGGVVEVMVDLEVEVV